MNNLEKDIKELYNYLANLENRVTELEQKMLEIRNTKGDKVNE